MDITAVVISVLCQARLSASGSVHTCIKWEFDASFHFSSAPNGQQNMSSIIR